MPTLSALVGYRSGYGLLDSTRLTARTAVPRHSAWPLRAASSARLSPHAYLVLNAAQPRRAASIAATSILRMPIIASNTRLAAARSLPV